MLSNRLGQNIRQDPPALSPSLKLVGSSLSQPMAQPPTPQKTQPHPPHPLKSFCEALMQTLHGIPAVLMVRVLYQAGQSYECCSSLAPQQLQAALVSTLTACEPPQWRDQQPCDCVVTQAGSQLWVYHLLLAAPDTLKLDSPSDHLVQVATCRLLDPGEKAILKAQCQLFQFHLELYRTQQTQQATITLLEEVIRRISHQLFHPLATIRLCVENARWSLKELRFPQKPDPVPALGSEEVDFVAHLWTTQARIHQSAHQGISQQIKTIAATTDSLGSTLKRLVACARSSSLCLDRHDLGSLMAESIDRLTPKADHQHVQIQHPRSSVWAQVDAVLLGQVLDNLLDNAIDFSPKGGVIQCQCQPVCNQAQNQALITISDQGSGLSKEALQSAFKAFYSSRPQGIGLGLTIAQKIVTDHNGTIWVENKPDGGARFSITLPLEPLSFQSDCPM